MEMHRKMTDLHMHLIPGVDDGAEDPERALLMIYRAREEGITEIFATPHSSAYDAAPQRVKEAFARLSEQAARFFPGLKLYPGCEVYCEPYCISRILNHLESGEYPTMNGTDRVLMEFPYRVLPEHTLGCVQALTRAGWKPIIAHMERYPGLRAREDLTDSFLEQGALLQVNAYSLWEEPNEDIRAWARQLVRTGRVSFLGTDAHRPNHRPPKAKQGISWLYAHLPEEEADKIAWGNAEKILQTGIG